MEKLYIESKDCLVSNFKNWKEKGKLITNPEYQRDFVYNDERASRLIESALMSIPIPTIYLCEEGDGKYSVIDGQQRIESFIRFIHGDYKLKKLEVFSDLNGKAYADLSDEFQTTLDDTSLRTIIIKKESANAKYDIFERLNRGAVTLKEQEIRNCVYRGPFNQLLNELSQDKKVQKMFVNPNNRMLYQEVILRFFALSDFFSYKGNMKKFLNDYMQKHQNDSATDIKELYDFFKKTLSTISEILGENAFYNVEYEKKEFTAKFGTTFYDSLMVAFSKFDATKLMNKRDKIEEEINKLKLYDDEYHTACYAGTGSRDRVVKRISKVINLLESIVGSEGYNKEKRLFDPNMKKILAEKQNYICPICNQKIVNLSEAKIDHIRPFAHGGLTEDDNAQLTHALCNLQKSDK